MQKSKDIVYDFVRKTIYTKPGSGRGITTLFISEALKLQRTNVSTSLNELVNEGLLKKTDTRPVLYTIAEQEKKDAFTSLIGYDGSLKKACQLAKAAALYPNGSLNIQIFSKPGSGTSFFVSQIIKFAKDNNVLSLDAPNIVINCRNFAKDIHSLDEELFGPNGDFENSCFDRARGGILFLNHYDFLDSAQQSRILDLLDREQDVLNQVHESNNKISKKTFLILSCSQQSNKQIEQKIQVNIKLPSLDERPYIEKLALINLFFSIEAKNAQRNIIVSIDVLKALLLADYDCNIKNISLAILMACANAYVRVVDISHKNVNVYPNDLNATIRKSLLKEKENSHVVKVFFEGMNEAFYDYQANLQNDFSNKNMNDLYANINKQYEHLIDQGISNGSIKSVINNHIQEIFNNQNYSSFNTDSNPKKLEKVVDPKIISIVQNWLNTCKKNLNRDFGGNVFYGLCLHINSLLALQNNNERVNKQQVRKLIFQYPLEYKEAVKLSQILQDELELKISTEEVALITMFLVDPQEKNDNRHPVVLYVMHGNGTAKSLMETTNSLTQSHYSFAYDMNLETEVKTAKEDIESLILKINQGKGVIAIYDMGSIKSMLETISEETDIKIRMLEIPITLIGINAAHRSSMETDIDYVYHLINTDINRLQGEEQKKEDTVITLCHTGEGGAEELKNYIEQYSKLNLRVVPLSISNREKLIKEVIDLRKIYHISAFVGTYDPKLFGIPFISINKIFENSKMDLDSVLTFKPILSRYEAYEQIYEYFKQQFKYTSVSELKIVLPEVMDQLCLSYQLTEDQRIGLFVHLGCLIERTLSGKELGHNMNQKKINLMFKNDYHLITRIMKKIEKKFTIIINDDEIATMIMIIKKLQI
ncbi:PRD domain-containing protein [Oenococcus sp. UCMA 16435]|nr:PRD domain-containing protein [Oenococcus sp. UCMA 16435]MDI4585166.1 PRD domain-containing protein [Oenococcus sp. UCMA 14587]